MIKAVLLASAVLTAVIAFSNFWPQIEKKKIIKTFRDSQEKFRADPGETVLEILGAKTEKKTEDEGNSELESEAEDTEKELRKSISELMKEKIEEVVMEKSSEKIIDVLKTLPPEEFEKFKKEFCPRFCQPPQEE